MKIKPGLFALLIGGFAFILLISSVYAFLQRAEAERMAETAFECERISRERAEELHHKNEELTKLTDQLRQQIIVSEENLLKAQEAAKKAAIQSKNKK
jgi:hypothetical protein